jgi:hypothetical protein
MHPRNRILESSDFSKGNWNLLKRTVSTAIGLGIDLLGFATIFCTFPFPFSHYLFFESEITMKEL